MLAITQHGYGAPERVLRYEEIQLPVIGADDVLVRMRATSVNTPDWAVVTGVPYLVPLFFGLRRPRHPVRGSDLSGVVHAVGQRVTDLAPGDEVFGSVPRGAFAQYVVAPAAQLIKKPAGIGFADAAASVMSGLTALVAMRDVAQVGAGTRVLVNGASGGVGTMAVQVAKVLGAEVTGVCGPRNVELVQSLGADHVIDYTKDDFTKGEPRFDVVLDNVLNHPPKLTARVLAPGGVLMPNSLGTDGLLGALPRMARAVLMGLGRTKVRLVSPKVNHESLNGLLRLLESGEVRVVIDRTYPLDQAASGIAYVAEHHASGNVAITA
jgi:NADPH:quinone reductase-like Zn-dependent oxidoreductase